MTTVALLIFAIALLIVIWRSEVGEWLAWNASFFLGREQAERRALARLEWKLGVVKRLIRAIARAEGRLGHWPEGERHTR
ncbi:MAG: hypothetical protein JOZ25_12120 [Actinobacteria bacterium]|nr:hypothetical protein [Actinomycetota bacterium]